MMLERVKKSALSALKKIEKLKITILILIIGVILMCIPIGTAKDEHVTEGDTEELFDLQIQLQEILSQVDGVGSVRVLLSPDTGKTHRYQEDTQNKISSDGEEVHKQTVMMTGGGKEEALKVNTQYPTYRGAVVVCEGADKATVKLAVVVAVSNLTGLGSDQIAVIKMKKQ